MAQRLYGFLSHCMAGEGHLMTAEGEEVSLDDAVNGSDIILFAPATEISILSAVIPALSEAEAKRAAPYAVEDDLAVSVDALHFALGAAPADKQDSRRMHVTAIDKMQEWADWLGANLAFRQAQLVAEQSVLMPGDIYKIEARYVGNISEQPFVLDATLPDDIIHDVLQGHIAESISQDDYLRLLADRTDNSGALINLRQGRFRARAGLNTSGFKPWRLSAGLAAALGLVWGMNTMLETSSLRSAQKTLEASIEASFAEALPDVPKPTNYVRAVARAVQGQGGGSQIAFRDASAALYAALQDVPEAQLLSMRYEQDDGELIARVSYSAYGTDTTLKTALAAVGIDASLGDARQESTGVVGDITIRRSGL